MLKNSLKGLDWDVLLTEREGEDDGDAIDTKRTQYNMADRALTAALQKYNKVSIP